jgi:hypothetical protein
MKARACRQRCRISVLGAFLLACSALAASAAPPDASELAAGDGRSDESGAFAAADQKGVIEVGPGRHAIGRDIALAHPLDMRPGASLVLAAGVTLRLADTPTALPGARIFEGRGHVVIEAAREPVYAEWWGAVADGATPSGAAFQAAEDALPNGGTIRALAGTYVLPIDAADAVTITHKVSIVGAGVEETTFAPQGDGAHAMFVLDGQPNTGDLRDFAIRGTNLPTPRYVGVRAENAGISDVGFIWIAGVGTGMELKGGNALDVNNIRIQGCTHVCLALGGGVPKKQFFGDAKLQEIVLAPQTEDGAGMVIDGGANALYARRVEIIGGARGLTIANTIEGAQRPTNIWFWESNFDAARDYAAAITSGWHIEFHQTTLNGVRAGPGLLIAAAKEPGDVDGVWCDACEIEGNAADGILWRRGRNLRVIGSLIHANGGARPSDRAGVRIERGAQGLFELEGCMCGLNDEADRGWGNDYVRQGWGLVLEDGALADAAGALPALGRIIVLGNMLGGNERGAILDKSAAAPARKLIANNLLN